VKAIVLTEAGGIDKLKLVDVPVPAIKEDEVLTKVKATSVDPVDAKTRIGKSLYNDLKKDPPIILGWDISGVVEAIGAAVTEFKIGDEVFGMINFPGHGKAYAEYVAAPAAHLALKPKSITHKEAAAATLAALTAWQALVSHGNVKKGQRLLIHAAAGGVGHYAVQIAKHLGAYVIATSSAGNKNFVLALGADEHIDYKTQQVTDEVKEIDFVLDPIGRENVDRSIAVTKSGGTVIVLPSGSLTQEKIQKAKQKNVACYFFVVTSNANDIRTVASLLERGIIRSHISQTFSFDNIGEAHLQIESGRTRGKIVVTV
jgi:NADPH:quinone reductase-like Zn-dependent oxidoreductase